MMTFRVTLINQEDLKSSTECHNLNHLGQKSIEGVLFMVLFTLVIYLKKFKKNTNELLAIMTKISNNENAGSFAMY